MENTTSQPRENPVDNPWLLITQAKAMKRLRAETGRSLEWCQQKVKELATVPDGSRMKVRGSHLNALIQAEQSGEPIPAPAGVRPISDRKAQKIKEYA